jgi:hypothetical protein
VHINRFVTGLAITVYEYVPWYKRAWRQIKRVFVKPAQKPTLIVTGIDHTTGTITLSDAPLCSCGSETDRHVRKCALVRAWLIDFGVDNPMVPDWPIPDVVDLSNTRFAK